MPGSYCVCSAAWTHLLTPYLLTCSTRIVFSEAPAKPRRVFPLLAFFLMLYYFHCLSWATSLLLKVLQTSQLHTENPLSQRFLPNEMMLALPCPELVTNTQMILQLHHQPMVSNAYCTFEWGFKTMWHISSPLLSNTKHWKGKSRPHRKLTRMPHELSSSGGHFSPPRRRWERSTGEWESAVNVGCTARLPGGAWVGRWVHSGQREKKGRACREEQQHSHSVGIPNKN